MMGILVGSELLHTCYSAKGSCTLGASFGLVLVFVCRRVEGDHLFCAGRAPPKLATRRNPENPYYLETSGRVCTTFNVKGVELGYNYNYNDEYSEYRLR